MRTLLALFLGCSLTQPTLVTKLAQLFHGENRRNLTDQEALAIGDTVLNRTQLHGYPDDPMDVLHQPNQYSPFQPSDPNYPVIQKFGPGHPQWERYYQLALIAAAPTRPRSQFTHYFTGDPPAWARGMDLKRIGSHWFGAEKRARK